MQPDTLNASMVEHAADDGARPVHHALRDGYEVHSAALARGLNVTLLPRQVLEVSSPADPEKRLGFSHGVPQASTLSGVTYAQDLRMRRAILAKAGFAVPKGATFSVGRSKGSARRYAERTGYPVVLKPAVGDNTVEVQSGLQDRADLNRAINYLYTPPSQREEYVRAAYALTELREPGRVNGKLVAPPGYRFLIEEHVHGQYLRFLVIDGQVCNVLHCSDGPWKTPDEEIQDVTAQTHQSLKQIAEGTVHAVPGMSVAAVDLIVPDHSAETVVEDAPVVEFSERPWLAVQGRHSPELAARLADEILRFGAADVVRNYEPREAVSLDVLIGGAVDPVKMLDVLSVQFEALGIIGELVVSDQALGQVSGSVHGAPEVLAWLMETLLETGIGGQRAMLVEQRQKAGH